MSNFNDIADLVTKATEIKILCIMYKGGQYTWMYN